MLITGYSHDDINNLKHLLNSQFHMKDLGDVTYFLGLEISKNSQGIFVPQHKYTLNLIKEAGL